MAKLLVVDDEEHIRLLYSEELKEVGYEVITAESGYKLLELFEECPFVTQHLLGDINLQRTLLGTSLKQLLRFVQMVSLPRGHVLQRRQRAVVLSPGLAAG